ncbi:putative membrane protein [Saccharothrix espanaensis DSM 44229]|uniref:Putative membrane protein n=2 Tax=Saccharothrix espanaensis TaxID=103731 RepID=K0KFB7_SACES|nr:putative membrane protein [Saccharothrix espanaensis DSM 44229]
MQRCPAFVFVLPEGCRFGGVRLGRPTAMMGGMDVGLVVSVGATGLVLVGLLVLVVVDRRSTKPASEYDTPGPETSGGGGGG